MTNIQYLIDEGRKRTTHWRKENEEIWKEEYESPDKHNRIELSENSKNIKEQERIIDAYVYVQRTIEARIQELEKEKHQSDLIPEIESIDETIEVLWDLHGGKE